MNTQKNTYHFSLVLSSSHVTLDLAEVLAPFGMTRVLTETVNQTTYLDIEAEGYDLGESMLEAIEQVEQAQPQLSIEFVCENSFYRALCKEERALANAPQNGRALYLPTEGKVDPIRAQNTIAIHRINRALQARKALTQS
ncbi:hypothetical protein [Ferrimonas pelagia]|uniref:Uncharacterized protein n=1 Tax=Ferrimonas pelagia TaxID=1177826 RepID=A0ABP9FFY6_9GAMM